MKYVERKEKSGWSYGEDLEVGTEKTGFRENQKRSNAYSEIL